MSKKKPSKKAKARKPAKTKRSGPNVSAKQKAGRIKVLQAEYRQRQEQILVLGISNTENSFITKRLRTVTAELTRLGARPQGAGTAKAKPAPLKSLAELGAALPSHPTRKPSQIKVGSRFREDGRDKEHHVDAIAASIDARGAMLEPVVIDTHDKLIDGECRLLAWQKSNLGRGKPIPVHVVSIDDLVAGEYDANAIRKDFRPSELVAIKRAIEAKLAPAAKERQRSGKKAEGGAGRVMDVVAKVGGKGARSIEKAEAVVRAAEQDPGRFGGLKADMDRTGRVDGPYKRLQNIKRQAEIAAAPPGLPMQGPYRSVLIDFPWASEEDGDAPGRGYYPYPTMGLDEICTYAREQIRPIMHSDGCAVWLLIPNFHIVRGWHVRILEALGVTASTMLTWCKSELGRGKRLRGRSEHAILGIAGDVPIVDVAQGTFFTAPTPGGSEHSAKPPELLAVVEKVTPASRYAYLFAGAQLPENWDGHGDRVGQGAVGTAPAADVPPPPKLDCTLLDALRAIEQGVPFVSSTKLEAELDGLAKGKKKRSLTKAGTAKLAEMLAEESRRVVMDSLPDDVDQLVDLYRKTLKERDQSVLDNDQQGAVALADKLDLLQERANGNTNFGMACDDSPAERLRAETAAPIGAAPLWGQRAIWQMVVDGMQVIVTHDADCGFCAHAVDPTQPFISETGFLSLDCMGDPSFGHTVAEQAEAYIRENIVNEKNDDGSKRHARKKTMPLPANVYRLPTSWAEAEHGTSPAPITAELLEIIQAKGDLPWAPDGDEGDAVLFVFRGYPDTRRGPDKGFRVMGQFPAELEETGEAVRLRRDSKGVVSSDGFKNGKGVWSTGRDAPAEKIAKLIKAWAKAKPVQEEMFAPDVPVLDGEPAQAVEPPAAEPSGEPLYEAPDEGEGEPGVPGFLRRGEAAE